MARPAISIGDALLTFPGASGSLLALVEAPTGLDSGLVAHDEHWRDMLRWVAGLEYGPDLLRRLKVTLRLTADVTSSIRQAVVEMRSTSLVLEWPTITSPRRHRLNILTEQLLTDPATDVMLVRSDPTAPSREIAPRSILAPIRGGPSARIVASTAAALADAYSSALTFLHVQVESQHPDRSRREWETFEQIVEQLHRPSTVVRLRRDESPEAGITAEAASHDLLIVGTRQDPQQPKVLVGRALMRVIRRLERPAVMVRPKHAGLSVPAGRIEPTGHD
jgi:nucleotide-binding universal stress UspA family protein